MFVIVCRQSFSIRLSDRKRLSTNNSLKFNNDVFNDKIGQKPLRYSSPKENPTSLKRRKLCDNATRFKAIGPAFDQDK